MVEINERMKSFYFDVCKRIAELSRAKRLQVGSLIVKNGNIIAYGWNGTPPNWNNECEEIIGGNLKTKPEVIHSEQNSLYKLASSNESGNNASMFCTHSPCIECAKGVVMSGIKNFYFIHKYRSDDGLSFLQKSGINIEQR